MNCRNHFFYLFGYQHSAKNHFNAEFEFAESKKCYYYYTIIILFFIIILPFNILFSIKFFSTNTLPWGYNKSQSSTTKWYQILLSKEVTLQTVFTKHKIYIKNIDQITLLTMCFIYRCLIIFSFTASSFWSI